MKKHMFIRQVFYTTKPALICMLFIGCITSAQAQTQADVALCKHFGSVGKENTELRDAGKTREQVISYNNRYFADKTNRNSVYQEYITEQVEKIFSEDYKKLSPAQIQEKFYGNCIDIFKRAEQNK